MREADRTSGIGLNYEMNSRPRVLIPSDNFDFVANFAAGYKALGFDVTAGCINFELQSAHYDIVHVLWPEEFSGWNPPTADQVDTILKKVDGWAARARLIVTVNNVYPHRHPDCVEFNRLYAGFFERAEVIHHFSPVSKRLICERYPSISDQNHVVRIGFNYERLLPSCLPRRADARHAYGLDSNQMVYLVFGALRFWDEVCLLQSAFRQARVPNKVLLCAAHYVGTGPGWRRHWRQWRWKRWRQSEGVRSPMEWVPDAELPRLFTAADAVVVVRQHSLTSGVPNMAMTFGRFVIAPNIGSTPEFLAGTENGIYDQSSVEDLSRVMERAAVVDRESIGKQNAGIAAGWGWTGIVQACLDGLPAARVLERTVRI